MVDDVLTRAEDRGRRALELLEELHLRELWAEVGRVQVVGAVAYGLVVPLDIDLEVFTPGQPSIAAGFEVLAALATHPCVLGAGFSNHLHSDDQGLYWKLKCRKAGSDWKVDMWLLPEDHPGPLSSEIVEPMQAALTDETRRTILALKEARASGEVKPYQSLDIYRAVFDGGVRTPEELAKFLGPDYAPRRNAWAPTR